MRKVSPQDFENLSFKVQMLTERLDRFSPMSLESVENMNRRIIRLEDEIAVSKRILSSQEAAEYLGISRPQLYQLIRSSQLPYSKPRHKMFFDKNLLDNWIAENSFINQGL